MRTFVDYDIIQKSVKNVDELGKINMATVVAYVDEGAGRLTIRQENLAFFSGVW